MYKKKHLVTISFKSRFVRHRQERIASVIRFQNVLSSITDEGSFPAYVRGIAGYTLDVKPAWK